MGGVLVGDGQLEDAGADGLVLLERRGGGGQGEEVEEKQEINIYRFL